jgi:hypothetical protein
VLDHDGGKLLATLPAQVATASAATAVSPDGASVAVVSGEGSSVTLYSTSEPDRPAELLYSCARLLW